MNHFEIFGITFAMMSVVFGAFGAHMLKKRLPESALQSFEVGVRYMMYHGLALLILSLMPLEEKEIISWIFIAGTFIFSFSIFFLSLQPILKVNMKWLGPITPVGGVLLVFGWILLLFKFIWAITLFFYVTFATHFKKC